MQGSREESLVMGGGGAREFSEFVQFSEPRISDSELYCDSDHCEGLRAPVSKACGELQHLELPNTQGKQKATGNHHLSSFSLPAHDFYPD